MPSSLPDVLARHCEDLPTLDLPLSGMAADARGLPILAEVLGRVPDQRNRRGRRYRLGAVLALCAAAVLGGARTLAQVCRWARAVDPVLWATVGFTVTRDGRARLPVATTPGRILATVDGDALDDALGSYLTALLIGVGAADDAGARKGLAVDGKTVRGARRADGTRPHLVAAATHDGVVLAQRQVAAKSGETNCFTGLLEPLNLRNAVITADALHTVREQATWLVETKGADYIMIVKGNQCAARRSVVSPPEAGGTRKEVSGSDGSPGAERRWGPEHARKSAARPRRLGWCVVGPRDMAKA